MIFPKLKLKNKFDAILISSNSSIEYLTNYSGFSKDEREAFLFIAFDEKYILTDGRYKEAVKNLVPNFKLIEVSSKNTLLKILKDLKKKYKIKTLGVEENELKFSEYKTLSKYYNNIYHYSSINLLRTTKQKDEIEKIEKACQLGDKTFKHVLKKIKIGVSEKYLANEIEFYIKSLGADISFRSIVAFGKNAAIPHHQTSDKQLETSDKFVLLDFGVKYKNYCSDMTRTVFFGKPSTEQKKIYKTVLEAQNKSIKYIKEHSNNTYHFSVRAKDVDLKARRYIEEKGYPTIPHSVGHGIGIDVHETPYVSPKSKDVLKENMVFSIEPGIYVPGFGGVRIEDLVVLEKNGPRVLTNSNRKLIIV